MHVSERERQAVEEWFREQMGADRARTLMQLLPPTPRDRWWWAADPRDSFWVTHGTGFFLGQAFGTMLMVLVILIGEATWPWRVAQSSRPAPERVRERT